MITGSLLVLRDALEELKDQVVESTARDGLDAHQVELDHLVWCHARVETANALTDWADQSQHLVAGQLADASIVDALAHVRPTDPSIAMEIRIRLAQIAGALEPLEDIGASEDHRLLRATLREFARREIKPIAQRIHREDLDIPDDIIADVAGLGLFGTSIPAAYGGALDAEDSKAMLIATEELARVSLGGAGSLITRPAILVRALLRGGTEEQRREWLPAIASGEKLVAVAVTEADHGSDVANLTCRAMPQPNGDWEIDGTKLWCTHAGRSELLMVLCRTAGGGHRGLSAFVIEKPPFAGHEFEFHQPEGGALRGRAIPTIGYRGMHTFELGFDHFRVPADALIGGKAGLNRGFYLQMDAFSAGRIQTAGRAVGLMQAAFEDALEYARTRLVFGEPIFANQLARAKIGGMALRLHGSRQLSYRAARLLDDGHGQTEASLAKLYASRMAEVVTREATQLFGAMGYSEETDVSRYFVDSRVLAIFEGAEDVLSLKVIGPAVLGGSRE
jgi:(2S)-methylsuccinyl-CoA dehydrogenase